MGQRYITKIQIQVFVFSHCAQAKTTYHFLVLEYLAVSKICLTVDMYHDPN
jgi:hypothetical protein